MNAANTDVLQCKKRQFEEFFNQYYQKVYQYLIAKVSSTSVAEDLAMDAFTICWNKFESFDPAKASFGTWLYVIVNNKLKNYYRDRKIFDEVDENASIFEDFEDSIIAAEYLSGMRHALSDALETLPPVQREIIIHKYFHEKNTKEIALLMGLTPGNVRVQLYRGLKKLETFLRAHNIQWEN